MSELDKKLLKILLTYIVIIIFAFSSFIYVNVKLNRNIFSFIPEQIDEKIISFLNSRIPQKVNSGLEDSVEIKTENKAEEKKNNIKKLSILDKYSLNNIEIKQAEIHQGKKIEEYETFIKYQLEGEFFQIKGLKNITVEDKINSEIEHAVRKNLKESFLEDTDILAIRSTAYVRGNFSGILSVDVCTNIEKKDGNYEYKSELLNYRLDTGEYIKFEELFTEDTNINLLISKAFYEGAAWQIYSKNPDITDDLLSDFDNIEYGEIENTVINYVNEFNNSEKNFFVTETEIVFDLNDYNYTLSIYDNYKNINLYNIVDDENLYVNGNNEKVDFIGTMPYISDFMAYDKLNDNTHFSVFSIYKYMQKMGNELDEYGIKETEAFKNNLSNIKDTILTDTNKNKRNGYLYNINSYSEEFYIGDEQYFGKCFYGNKLEFTYDNFDKEVENLYSIACASQSKVEYYFDLNCFAYQRAKTGNIKCKVYSIKIYDLDDDGNYEYEEELSYDSEEPIEEFY